MDRVALDPKRLGSLVVLFVLGLLVDMDDAAVGADHEALGRGAGVSLGSGEGVSLG